jgi:hypothetical protein
MTNIPFHLINLNQEEPPYSCIGFNHFGFLTSNTTQFVLCLYFPYMARLSDDYSEMLTYSVHIYSLFVLINTDYTWPMGCAGPARA